MPDGFFTAEALENYIAAQQAQRFVRIRRPLSKSKQLDEIAFYRPLHGRLKNVAYGVCLFFWKRQRLICVIAINAHGRRRAISHRPR